MKKYKIKDCHVKLERLRPEKDKHVCEYCDKSFKWRSKLKRHLNFQRGYKQYSCTVCAKKFVTKGALNKHTQTHESNRERLHACNVCGKSFYRNTELKRHNNIHTQSKQYTCHLCPRVFNRSGSLQKHINGVHNRQYRCTLCGKYLTKKGNLKTHMLHVHGEPKTFPCPVCNKQIKYLKKHIAAVHSSDKKMFTCQQCPATFTMKSYMKGQVECVHLGATRYCCDVCSFKFYYKGHLVEHMRRHNWVKPFNCSICNKKFVSKSELTAHSTVHTDERNYSCIHCNKKFKYRSCMKIHIRRVHSV